MSDSRCDTRLNIGSDGFFMMIVACSAVVLAIIAIILTNLPAGPYPWIFLITFFFLILIGGLLYKKMENDRLNRENAIKNNRQIVIRAIGDQFESQRNACLEIKNKSSNISQKEIQQIIQIIDQGLVQLYEQYQNCVNVVQTSTDVAVFEQVKNNFSSHAVANRDRLVCCAQEINRLDILLSQQNLIRKLQDQCEPLIKKIQKLMEICCFSIWTAKLKALKSDFDTLISQTVSRIETTTEEIKLSKVNNDVEASLKEFGTKTQEFERVIAQKGSMLKSIRSCLSQVDTKYRQTLGTLPNTLDEEFLDIQNLKAMVDPVKDEADNGFQCK